MGKVRLSVTPARVGAPYLETRTIAPKSKASTFIVPLSAAFTISTDQVVDDIVAGEDAAVGDVLKSGFRA